MVADRRAVCHAWRYATGKGSTPQAYMCTPQLLCCNPYVRLLILLPLLPFVVAQSAELCQLHKMLANSPSPVCVMRCEACSMVCNDALYEDLGGINIYFYSTMHYEYFEV